MNFGNPGIVHKVRSTYPTVRSNSRKLNKVSMIIVDSIKRCLELPGSQSKQCGNDSVVGQNLKKWDSGFEC